MNPVLVLQMQRMGDLIMTFPLLGWLSQRYPGHPLWTVAEPRFFTALQSLAPKTVFFPPEAHERMRGTTFHRIINLSHRPDAARIAGSLETERRFGAYLRGEVAHIGGYWALYRASIVHNNRHNLFHWSDLHLLDHVDDGALPQLPACPAPAPHNGKVGIFVGASEKEKRPTPEFFGRLARALLRKGLRPLFLGGPEDAPLGEAAAAAAGIPGGNMCGRFSVAELAEAMRGLALCITPDTGPMHLAAWVGVPVLNLSMGPVNPWETGPTPPGHYVLRPRISCAGCWSCRHSAPRCARPIRPSQAALLAHALLRHPRRLTGMELSGMELCRTARDAHGLYLLEPLSASRCPAFSARMLLARFWREWFLEGAALPARAAAVLEELATHMPALAKSLAQETARLGRDITRRLAAGEARSPLPGGFWAHRPPLIRILAGHMHLRLQNEDFSPAAWEKALHDVERLGRILGPKA